MSPAKFTYTKSGNLIAASIPRHASDGGVEPSLVETFAIKKLNDNGLLLGTKVVFNYCALIYTETETQSFVKLTLFDD